MLLLERVDDSDTSVSEESDRLQADKFERTVERWEEILEDARVEAGLADTRLLLLTVRTLLRLRLRLSATTSTEGGSTAFGMIFDMYVAWGEMDITVFSDGFPGMVNRTSDLSGSVGLFINLWIRLSLLRFASVRRPACVFCASRGWACNLSCSWVVNAPSTVETIAGRTTAPLGSSPSRLVVIHAALSNPLDMKQP